jgi:hypothetical protein
VAEVHAQRSYYNRRQYLVRWEGWSISEATWEDEEGLFGNPKLAAYLNKKARDLTGMNADLSVAEGSAGDRSFLAVYQDDMAWWSDSEKRGGQVARRFNPGMLAECRKQVERVRRVRSSEKLRSASAAVSLSCHRSVTVERSTVTERLGPKVPISYDKYRNMSASKYAYESTNSS